MRPATALAVITLALSACAGDDEEDSGGNEAGNDTSSTPEGTESTGIDASAVEHNAVLAGDLDGQGGQEILRAVPSGGETLYERIYTVDCG